MLLFRLANSVGHTMVVQLGVQAMNTADECTLTLGLVSEAINFCSIFVLSTTDLFVYNYSIRTFLTFYLLSLSSLTDPAN